MASITHGQLTISIMSDGVVQIQGINSVEAEAELAMLKSVIDTASSRLNKLESGLDLIKEEVERETGESLSWNGVTLSECIVMHMRDQRELMNTHMAELLSMEAWMEDVGILLKIPEGSRDLISIGKKITELVNEHANYAGLTLYDVGGVPKLNGE